MSYDDHVHDALPVNPPYTGLVAEAYDVWMPPGADDSDVALYRDAIEREGGPALELGCGNGRLLIGYARAGLDVEGVDQSVDMLTICAAHARDSGVDLTLHCADWLSLVLGRTYATLYNPAASFSLIASDDDALAGLKTWREHLRPGGQLLVSMGEPTEDLDAHYDWRVRRSATRARDGVTFMVHEAFRFDTDAQMQLVLHRHELWSADGELMTTFVRRHRLRWWTRAQLEGLLRTTGYVDVRSFGGEDGFIAVGRST
ncbi:MAG: hypothetical protein QOF59_327 [Actinomycetota bacterium]|nr:hypothetical protein [Actinomycetota bacterium]